ncbi:MAG: FAD-dependent oxidoreductase [Epsilonproteobacteria bacterium]|nr:FAD-dependent oxidoreductase [Campylobacterota bacterium]
MADIVIIGAGLTGISAAYHLEKKGFSSYRLFEKEQEIGGLCRSVTQDGFTFDFTGHLLHASDPYFSELIAQVVGVENLNSIDRASFIYSHHTFTRYPFQANLYGLPEQVIVDCIAGFVNRTQRRTHATTFEQWVQQHFGAGFARHFFLPYQAKIFAYALDKITASWTDRFVPSTSLEQIIKGALRDCYEQSIGYNAQFLYPKQGGIISWVKKLADQINAPIATDFCVQSINMKEKCVTFTNGHVEPYTHLISTMPLDRLLQLLVEKPSTCLVRARKKLLCNTVVNFNLGIQKEAISDKHWIYFPEAHYPFYRIGFAHNFARSMVPEGCSSVYGEFAYMNKSDAWVDDTLRQALVLTKQFLALEERDILTEKIIHIPHAYVIYDHWRERNLDNLLAQLKQESIYSVGRYGQWKYSSMQEAVLDGKKIADTLTVQPAKQALEHQNPCSYQYKELEA